MFDRGSNHQITRRELEIVDCLVEGATARDVADQLDLSFHTVRTHIKNIYDKLGVINRVELVRWRDATKAVVSI
jgi:DNA-binding CsgD family transcriptional regulator